MAYGNCSKCGKALIVCPVCKGQGYIEDIFQPHLDCTECDQKGYVCPDHGKYC